jgi:Fe-S oxidoreductase
MEKSMLEELRREIYDCSRCGFCRIWGWEGVEHVCPTYPFTPGWETQYARGRVRMARATMEGELEVTEPFLDHAYACTMCGSCEVHCPVGMPLTEIFHAWRVDLAESGHVLPTHERVVTLVEKYLNPYGPPPDDAPLPGATATLQELSASPEADSAGLSLGERVTEEPGVRPVSVLYYPGCTTNRMAVEIVEAVASTLKKLGLDYAVYTDDTCCGFPLYEIGHVQKAGEVARVTLDRIRQYRPEIVLTTCPSCYQTFKHLCPEKMGLEVDFRVEHISEFLLPRVQGKLADRSTTVTWHDPCVLGRHLGMYDPPRELLKSVPGMDLAEMSANREDALCCGAGGGVYFSCQKMANQAVIERLQQAVATEAEQIVTSCPNCYVRFRQMSRHQRLKIQARDLSMVIDEALADASPAPPDIPPAPSDPDL